MTVETILENDGIRLVRDGPVAELTIEREARRNSLDNLALEAIIAATRQIARSDIAVCVVASEGTKAFCAGSDLKALVGYDLSEKVLHTRLFQEAMTAVDELPCATIAAIPSFRQAMILVNVTSGHRGSFTLTIPNTVPAKSTM